MVFNNIVTMNTANSSANGRIQDFPSWTTSRTLWASMKNTSVVFPLPLTVEKKSLQFKWLELLH